MCIFKFLVTELFKGSIYQSPNILHNHTQTHPTRYALSQYTLYKYCKGCISLNEIQGARRFHKELHGLKNFKTKRLRGVTINTLHQLIPPGWLCILFCFCFCFFFILRFTNVATTKNIKSTHEGTFNMRVQSLNPAKEILLAIAIAVL